MTRSNLQVLALFASYIAAAIAVVGALSSFKSYYFGQEVVVKNIRAIAPLDVEHTLRFLTPQLSPTANVEFVQVLIRSRDQELTTIHRAWLQHAESQQELQRTQLILWVLAAVASFVACVAIHRFQRAL